MSSSKNSNRSHAEVWDDSALVNSWNDAVEEYKKYHSMAARGETLEEVLKSTESNANGVSEAMGYKPHSFERSADDPPAKTAKKDSVEETVDHESQSAKGSAQVTAPQPNPSQASDKTPPALPQHLIGQVHDDGLKNLLMSWYYAGYYTGLYEGQQQARTEQNAKHEA